MSLLALAAGLLLLLAGGDLLVRGASGLARRLGVSSLVIGLTVVAFGTSVPELAVNLLAALRGNTAIAFGNVIGSNLANIGLILGACALIRPLAVHSRMLRREMPVMLAVTVMAGVMAAEFPFLGRPGVYGRTDGLLLLVLMGAFLYFTLGTVRGRQPDDPLADEAERVADRPAPAPAWLDSGRVLGGLACLTGGGQLVVHGATALGRNLGVPEAIIGLTVVAVGTSLPELLTSVVATRRGETDIAVANVVGSNIFNLLFIMGMTATIANVPVPAGGMLDLLVLLAGSLMLWLFSWSHGRMIRRWEGAVLLVGWCLFTTWRAFQ